MDIYAADQELIAAGAKPYTLGTAWFWYDKKPDGQYDTSYVSVRQIDIACRHFGGPEPFVIDIEAFDLIGDRKNALIQLWTAARRWKSNQPTRQVGYYRLIPEREYWSPVSRQDNQDRWNADEWAKYNQRTKDWHGRNDANARDLLPFVDFVCPSIYIFYEGQDRQWRNYADANLAEAVRVADGVPVYPVLIPSIHPGDKAIPPETWSMMVEFITQYPGVHGLVVHTTSTYITNPNWREPVIAAMA